MIARRTAVAQKLQVGAPEATSQAESYWRGALAGFAAATPLGVDPGDDPTSAPGIVYAAESIDLLPKDAAALWLFAQQDRVSVASVLRGAWALLLSRYSGDDDVLFGSSVLAKGAPSSVVPVRAEISRDSGAGAWVKKLHRRTAKALRHADCSISDFQRWSGMPEGAALFESVFVHAKPPGAEARPDTAPIIERLRSMPFPCALALVAFGHGHLEMLYDRNRFGAATVRGMLDHFEALIRGITSRPDEPISSLERVTEARRQPLLVARTEMRSYPEAALPELIQTRAGEAPDRVAVVFEGQSLTYGQLDHRANQLARYLRKLGVGPGSLVGIYIERSLEMVVGLLGILKAGGSYLPLDPEDPTDRIEFVISDAGIAALLTTGDLAVDLPRVDAPVVCLDTEWSCIARESHSAFESQAAPEDLASVIYASDSAAEPKGTMNSQRAICNLLHWMQERFGLTAEDVVLHKTPLRFDVSVWELFWPLITGGRLVMARPRGHERGDYLARLIGEHGVTVLHFVPSMLWLFLEQPELSGCRSLRHVFCSREALPHALQERFFERLKADLHNVYSPTEAAIDVAFWTCEHDSSRGILPIGRPVANNQILVLDADLQLVPVGVAGELHIGGAQLPRGYLNRPELTAERFIENPFEPGSRLYKTGDLGRYLPDGSLECLGRIDPRPEGPIAPPSKRTG